MPGEREARPPQRGTPRQPPSCRARASPCCAARSPAGLQNPPGMARRHQ